MSVIVSHSGQSSHANGAAQVAGGNGKSPSTSPLLAAGFNALTASAVIVDRRGSIVAVNDAWRRYADDNGLRWLRYGTGYNYLAVLDNAARDGVAGAAEIAQGIRRVLQGPVESFRVEYSCEMPSGCQFMHDVTAFTYAGERHAVISHENVTTHRFNEAELRAAREAAETARREEHVRREAAERRLRVAETIADMLTIASSGQQLETVLQRMVERCSESLGSQAAAVYCAEQHWDRPELVAAYGAAPTAAANGLSPIEPAVLTKAIGDKRGIAIGDLWRESGSIGRTGRPPSLTSYRALLVTPVERSERFYGYLVHFYDAPRVFSADDLELARTFAQQVTLALENAEWRSRAEKAAVENERSRLARELHDAVTQTLFSTSVVAEALPRVWERDREAGRRALDDLRLWTRGALAEMRALLMELRPAALIEKPLADLICQLGEAAASRLLIAVTCEAAGDMEPPADVKLSVYRIAQEAVNNVTKHSSASHVEIHYLAGAQGLRLVITDDGRGFDPERRASGQMGLSIMRERARHAGARLTVRSAPGAGTEICVEWRPRGRK